VGQVAARRVNRGARGGRVVSRDVTPDDGRPPRIEPRSKAFVEQLEGRLDRDTTGARP